MANTIVVSIHLQNSHLYIIEHYSAPTKNAAMDHELTKIIKHIRFHHQDAQIVIVGDLNRSPQDAQKLARQFNIHLCQNNEDSLITHVTSILQNRIHN